MAVRNIANYTIIDKLGNGGMGSVYRARDTRLKRTVALKFLPPELTNNPAAKENFIREAQAASALNHPNIRTIYEVNEANGRTFIAMEYIQGRSLREQLADDSPMQLEEALDIAMQAASGLKEAHERNIVHCDVNPSNILISSKGLVKITDFGLALLLCGGESVLRNAIMGTAAYMSPEQTCGGEVDYRTDVWSLGVMIYEMVTGALPFQGEYEQAVVYSILNEEPEPLTVLQTGPLAEIGRLVDKALKKDPDERFQTIHEMMEQLQRISNGIRSSDIERRRIAVISFENHTGDQSYDYLRRVIPNLLITSLEQSKALQVVTWERMQDLLKLMKRGNADLIDKELGFELCRSEGLETVIVGSFTKVGDVFATDAKVMDVETKELLSSSTSKGVGVDSILERQIDELSRSISSNLGIDDRGGERGRPISEVTTSSMRSYHAFSRGRECFEKLYNHDAQVFLEEAVRFDPSFAVAYLYLARTFDRLKDTQARDNAFRNARALAGRASNKERLYIEAACARALDGDVEKRFRVLKQLAAEYPDEKRVHQNLASHYRGRELIYQALAEYNRALELDPGFGWALNEMAYMYTDVGEYERAHEYLQRYMSLSPEDANPVDSMGELYFRMGKFDKAREKYEQALALKPEFYYAYWEIAYIHALQENYSRSMTWIDRFIEMAPSFGTRTDGLRWKGFYLCWQGRITEALSLADEMNRLASEEGSGYWSTESDRLKGWALLQAGDCEGSRGCFQRCMDSVAARPTEYIPAATSYSLGSPEQVESLSATFLFSLALADIRDGRIGSAEIRLEKLKILLPDYAALLEGELFISQGDPDRAVSITLRSPAWRLPYMSDTGGMLIYNLPFHKDVLARAYLLNGDTEKAIASYEDLLTHGADGNDRRLIHPSYHYRLGRLYQDSGLEEKASGCYRKALNIWKDADPDLPEMRDAKARISLLS